MKKLYIDQQGIIKVIDVPEEPSVSISIYQDMARVNRYDRELAAAKEAGIEVHNQEQAKAMCNGWHFSCCPGKHRFDKTCLMIGTIHDLPEGWSIYFAWRCLKCGRLDCISCDSDCELDQKVVVLLPPVSQCDYREGCGTVDCTCGKVESQEDHIPDSGKMVERAEYIKGFNDAIDRVLMLMYINPWHADERIMEGYGYAIRDKAHEISRMRIPTSSSLAQ